jgi:circadian clock protein KaiC
VRRELQVLKFRSSDFASGYHDFAIRRGGIEVFPRLLSLRRDAPMPARLIASGVEALDNLLGGGIEPGTSTLLVGPPGSGKSTIAVQFAAAAVARGEHAAAFVFDETKVALLTRSHGLGLRFKEGHGPGEFAVRQIDPVEISPGEFAAIVRSSVERAKARVVIIDSLNGYLQSMPHSSYLASQLHELLAYLASQQVATFLIVAQNGMVGSTMLAPFDASYLADSVVLLRYFELAGKVRKAISVMKKRTGPHEESIRELWLDGQGVHLSAPLLGLRGVMTGVPVEIPAAVNVP